jgi:multimeric flavodoxin WrbA
MTLTDFQEELCTTSRWDFSDLKALYVNCTLKPSPEQSHTEGLMRISTAIMERNGVGVDFVRAVDHDLAPGVWPDMREHGAAADDWPELYERVQAADLVLGSPIWLGEKSSVCTRVVERLYACSSLLNKHGQYAYYGKVGGCLITGNEDGIKHCSDQHPLVPRARQSALDGCYAPRRIGTSDPGVRKKSMSRHEPLGARRS